ncbi:hypothetical protein C8Q80DRAFT_1273638 [Daedaleopsis nitida]|nr:hypothetical protein C8Q80DRAFT_1273638 [Daedaleopsis nitida]
MTSETHRPSSNGVSVSSPESQSRNSPVPMEGVLTESRTIAEKLSPVEEQLRAQVKAISEDRDALNRRVSDLDRIVYRLEQERKATEILLGTRASELREAHAFLSKVDDVPDSDVAGIVQHLNAIIYQTAASIADNFQPRFSVNRGSDAVRHAQGLLAKSKVIAKELIESLDAFDHREDPIVVQTALQATMVSDTKWLCTMWNVGDNASDVLRDMYLHIRHNEPQTVSGRWRALSHAHVKTLRSGQTEYQLRLGEKRLTKHIENILVASGVDLAASGEAKQQVVPSQAVHEIIALALRFQTVTSEHIVSRELSTVLVKIGRVFDSARMINEWEDTKRARNERVLGQSVLCTTKLGLQREVKNSGPGQGDQSALDTAMLIKPAVVLASMLDEVRREQRVPPQAIDLGGTNRVSTTS